MLIWNERLNKNRNENFTFFSHFQRSWILSWIRSVRLFSAPLQNWYLTYHITIVLLFGSRCQSQFGISSWPTFQRWNWTQHWNYFKSPSNKLRERGLSRLIESNWPWPGNHLSISKSKWQQNQIRLWSINEIWIALKRTGLLIRSMKFVGLEKRYLTIENAGLVYVALFLCNIIAGEFIRIKTISYSLYGAIIWYYRSI